ncbi:hypothetical protein OO17_26330 [Rhodopseudomonas palustris]|uniref:HTH tetR-type domain-containing protein n=1 Tax=Rhodopseudomonas palustris TaxID=1076 RepID=A0A0D7E1Z0_RHOPL|nr:hypothetical protein OO17_26330 [Rhodopseudomonas palustris]
MASDRPDGLRERKRRETFDRIAKTGLRLFIENGFEATTLDAIAAAAGISRRTFFYYFKSKEEVLLAQEGSGFSQALRTAMLEQSPDQAPIDAARECLLTLASRYETKESVIVDRLLRSTEALRARKEALFVDMERTLEGAMGEMWTAPSQRETHRVVAMMAIGTLRLALDDWRREDGRHPLAYYLRRTFALLQRQS